MLLKLYSLLILILDLIMLLMEICCSMLVAFYRTFNPLPLKSLNGEIAMVMIFIKYSFKYLTTLRDIYTFYTRLR